MLKSITGNRKVLLIYTVLILLLNVLLEENIKQILVNIVVLTPFLVYSLLLEKQVKLINKTITTCELVMNSICSRVAISDNVDVLVFNTDKISLTKNGLTKVYKNTHIPIKDDQLGIMGKNDLAIEATVKNFIDKKVDSELSLNEGIIECACASTMLKSIKEI